MILAIGGALISFFTCIWILQISRSSLGLPIVFMMGFVVNHLPGGVVHYLHPFQLEGYAETVVGMQMTTICMFAFLAGVVLFEFLQKSLIAQQINRQGRIRIDPSFWRFCAVSGIIVSVLIAPFVSFPTIGSVIKASANIWILGVMLALRAYTSVRVKPAVLFGWLAASLISPFVTLISSGFLGFGISALTSAYCILLVKPRRLLLAIISAALAFYFALGVAVTYFSGREEIRGSVWGGETNEQRLDSITNVFSKATLFEYTNLEHAFFIDMRLNQNFVVGRAESNMKFSNVPFFNGRTFIDSIVALVPRALWPEKPVFAGSGDLVTQVTGIVFAEGTSVGIGSVLESYANFGWFGLFLFHFPMGYFIRLLDFRSFRAEALGDYSTLLSCFLPALALNAVGGVFAEATAAALAAWLAGRGWFYLWNRIRETPDSNLEL